MKSRKMIAISVENYDKLKTFGFAGESLNQAVGNLLKLAAGDQVAMTIVEFTTTPLMASCRLVIDQLDALKNCGIDKSSLYKLKASFQSLTSNANSNLLKDFPIDITEEPIDDFWFEIGGPYHSALKFTEMKGFVIDTLEQAQRLSDAGLCLDALRVSLNYGNIVVFQHTDHFLVITLKKIDECQSSNEQF